MQHNPSLAAQQSRRVLVDIDCILDSRLSVLEKVFDNPEALGVDLKKYYDRYGDHLSLFCSNSTQADQAKFESTIKQRKIEDVLGKSLKLTSFFFDFCDSIHEQKVNGQYQPYSIETNVVINTYPYELDDGLKEHFKHFFEFELMYAKSISFISISNTFLSPDVLKDFDELIIYDLNDWVTNNHKLMLKNPIPSVNITAPYRAMDISEGVNVESFEEESQMVKQWLSSYVSIELIPISNFCISPEFSIGLEKPKEEDKEEILNEINTSFDEEYDIPDDAFD